MEKYGRKNASRTELDQIGYLAMWMGKSKRFGEQWEARLKKDPEAGDIKELAIRLEIKADANRQKDDAYLAVREMLDRYSPPGKLEDRWMACEKREQQLH